MSKESRKEDKNFSVTEVGTLIESFRHDVSIIAENVGSVSNRLENVEDRLSGVEEKLTRVDDAVRVALPDVFKRLSRLEAKVSL